MMALCILSDYYLSHILNNASIKSIEKQPQIQAAVQRSGKLDEDAG